MLTMYDPSTDSDREVTQEDVDLLVGIEQAYGVLRMHVLAALQKADERARGELPPNVEPVPTDIFMQGEDFKLKLLAKWRDTKAAVVPVI